MTDVKSLFDDLKTRFEPKAYRRRVDAASLVAVEPDSALEPVMPDLDAMAEAPAAPLPAADAATTCEPSAASGAAPAAQQPEPLPVPATLSAMTQSIERFARELEARDTAERSGDFADEPALPAKADTPGGTPLTGGNLIADVRRIAAGWFRNGRPSDSVHRGAGDLAMPEELAEVAADRGVSVSYAEKSVKALEDKDFPCIALDREGGSHILVGKPDAGTVLKQDGDTVESVPLGRLQSLLSGVIFFVKPKPAPSGAGDIAAVVAPPAPKGGFAGIFTTVASEMFGAHRGMLWQLALATVLSNLFMFAMPLFSMAVYDRVVPHLAWETLWALSLGVFIILAADFAIRYIRMKLMDSVGLCTASTLQGRMFSRIVHGKMRHLPTAHGSVATGVREVEALCHVVPALMVAVAIDVPFFLLAMALLYAIGGMVALTPLVGVMIMVGVHVISHIGEDAAKKHSRYVGSQTNALIETMGAMETVKTTGAERMLLRRWERLVDASSYASHLNRLQGNFAGQASVVIAQAVTVLAMIIGVYEISTGMMTIGAMTAAVLLIGRMMTPVSQLMALIHRAHQLSSAAQLMHNIFAMPQEQAGDTTEAREDAPVEGHIALRNVSFTYPGEQTPCLQDITLDIRPGEKIGLIGRVGSGKSTLLRLLTRIYEPAEGTLMIDGQDARQLSPRAIRRNLGFMRQDTVLFDDTLQANLSFGLEVMGAANFERAITISGVKEFAARNAAGFGMRVGSRGERLSGGERQSVALARLLAEHPQTYVLDEPTSAMDNALEARIVRDLKDTLADRTLIVATHRAPLLGLVDRIIWMDGGRIIADGPKAEVLKKLSQPAA